MTFGGNGNKQLLMHSLDIDISQHERISSPNLETYTSAQSGQVTGHASGTLYSTLSTTRPQIRLVILLPSKDEGESIHCYLQTIDRKTDSEDEENQYEALSYVWGDASKLNIVYLHDQPFQVTTNLYIALRFLRHSSKPRRLWIDAICIDQSNVEERNHQVRQMRYIYAGASRVLVWLGEPDGDTDKALDVLLHLPENAGTPDIREACKPVLTGIRKLLERPWWSRIWVLQETAVASQRPLAGCGRKWAPFEVLMRVSLMAWDDKNTFKARKSFHQGLPSINPGRILEDDLVLRAWEQLSGNLEDSTKSTFASIMCATSHRDATDPRDKIFAVLGLCKEEDAALLIPDYNLVVSEVYKRAMLVMLSKAPHHLCSAAGAKQLKLPSWCIDFSSRDWFSQTINSAALKVWPSGEFNNAYQAETPLNLIKDTISLPGVLVGTINYNMQILNRPATKNRTLDGFVSQLHHQDTEGIVNLGISFLEELSVEVANFTVRSFENLESRVGHAEACRMLAAGDVWRVTNGGAELWYLRGKTMGLGSVTLLEDYSLVQKFVRDRFLHWESVTSDWAHLLPATIPDEAFNDLVLSIITMPFVVVDCTLFTTDTGYIGKGANLNVQNGDIVVIFAGCNFPAILRRCGENTYKIVTFSYVQGLMEVEHFKNINPEDAQRFTLV